MGTTPDPYTFSDRGLFDSGYTEPQLDALLTRTVGAARLATLDEIGAMGVSLALGVSDGDVIELTDGGTVLLRTLRATIDGRCNVVRAELARGATLDDALETAAQRYPDPEG